MIKNFLICGSILLTSAIYSGCEPNEGGKVDPIYTEIAALEKTPDQVISWGDSLWVIYSDNKWESIKTSGGTKKALNFGNIGNSRFTALANDGINTFISSSADIYFQFSPTLKTYSKNSLIPISQPQNNPNVLHYSSDSTFIIKGYKAFKWSGSKFNEIPLLAPYNTILDFFKLDNNYFWFARSNDNFNIYHLLKSNLTLTKIDVINTGDQGNLTFLTSNGLKYGLITNSPGSSIKGYIFGGSTGISTASLSGTNIKEYLNSAYYVSPEGSLNKISISSKDGSLSGNIIINYVDLDNQKILNYWIYGNQYFLHLANNKLVTVKI